MQITPLGMMLLPLALLWAGKPTRLLQFAFASAVLEAGASFVVGGGFGLVPAMVPGLFFIASLILQYVLGMRYPAEASVLRTLTPLFALLGYALISELLLPSIFAGQVMVWPQKPDALAPALVPLQFNSGNITQSLYLLLNAGAALAAALFTTRRGTSFRGILSAYLLSGYIAVGIALWQFAFRTMGVLFPSDLLYSNPGYAIVEQNLGSTPRIQGSFTEPAGLAFYLSGLCFCCLWLSAQGHRVMRVNLLLPLAILAMLLSTSTTGLVTLAAGLPGMLLFALFRADRKITSRLIRKLTLLLLSGLIVLGPAFVLEPSLVNSVNEVVSSTMTKGDSDSYDQRTGADKAALTSLGTTYGLGVGWGSFRTSSFVPGLLANGGIFGAVAAFWLVVRITKLARRAKAAAPNHPARCVVDGFSAALCGQLAAALLSAPMISSLGFFLQLGCVIGAASRMLLDAGPVRFASLKISRVASGNLAQVHAR
jgi:hypothetical protein